MATFYAQFGNEHDNTGTPFATIYAHALFDNDNVVPYFGYYVSDADGIGDPVDAAGAAFTIIKDQYDAWVAARPGRDFRWAYLPQNWGKENYEASPVVPAFFGHADDFVNGNPSVFSQNSRAIARAWADAFFTELKSQLDGYGIPDPIYMDADWEGGGGRLCVTGEQSNPADMHASLLLYQADPRYDTELFDGRQTLKTFIDNWTDLDGNAVAEADLFPPLYQVSLDGAKQANIHFSISNLTADWNLHNTLYEPAKTVWPNVKCGNYTISCATRTYQTYSYRQKETPVDFNTNMWADIGVISFYANQGPWDAANGDPGSANLGYRQYYEMTAKYSIDTGGTLNALQQLNATVMADYTQQVTNMPLAAPAKQHAVWLTYGEAQFVHPEWLDLTITQWPPGAVTYEITPAIALEQLTVAIAAGTTHFGLYEPNTTNASYTTDILDFWATALASLPPDPEPDGTDVVTDCCLKFELLVGSNISNTYAMLFKTVGGVRFVYNIHDQKWEMFISDDELEIIDTGGTSGSSGTYVYSYLTFPLTLTPHISGQFTGSLCPFSTADSSGGAEITIEYWSSTGEAPDRTADFKLGAQIGFYDDTSCQWFDSNEDYQQWRASHVIQFGDSANEQIHADAQACCDDVEEILRIVRNIQSLLGQRTRRK